MQPAPATRRRPAELGQPPVVAAQRGPHVLETLGPVGAREHRRGEPTGEHRPGQGHLGMDALLLEHGEPPAVTITGMHPVDAVVRQPVPGRLCVDAHAGEPAGGNRPHRVGLGRLALVEPTEHRDRRGRQLAGGAHRVAVWGVDVGHELIEVVRGGVRVG